MFIDRSLLDSLRKDFTIKRNLSDGNSDIKDELATIMPLIENHLKQSTVEKTANWLLFQDLWLQNESGNLRSNTQYRNYTRGSIIMSVDWGTGNIGTEIRYPHPGVVLYDAGEDWVMAAPITGARLDQQTNQPVARPPFEVLAFKQNTKPEDEHEYWFRKHSVIQVDQIQRISKYRALNKNSYKIKDNLLNQVDNLVLEHYLPGKHKLMDTLKAALNEKNDELEQAKQEIARLRNELNEAKGH